MQRLLKLILSILLTETVGAVGGVFVALSRNSWYDSLIKPSFNPPSYIFFPVWIILYFLMGVSLFLIWENNTQMKLQVYKYFIIQIILNLFWSVIFFGLKNPLMALIEVVFLWSSILLMVINLYKVNKISGILQIPYLMWVTFASVLNFFVFILNR